MKLLKKTIIPVATVFVFAMTGCADFLDTTPHDSLNSDNALESIEDFDNTTKSVYESMRSQYYTANFMLMVPDVMSDNLVLNRNGRQIYNEFSDFRYYADTYGISGLWSSAYNAILGANEVITRLEKENTFQGNEKTISDNLLAECLALRGLIHFDLVRAYGKDYKTASDGDLGVTYKDYTEVDLPSRHTVKYVYSRLVEDLENAKKLMRDNYNKSINSRLNKKSISAILSRVYLTMGEDAKAVSAATDAIAGDGSDIASISDFSKIFTTSMEVPEVLFRIAITADNGYLPGNDWGQGSESSYIANYSVTYSLNELYKSTDIRRSQIKLVNGGAYNVVWKYNNGGKSTGLIDIPIIRASEVYLTRAEANYNLKNYDDALSDLNLVKERRYSDYEEGTESGAALEKEIQLQRRLELAFEGHRFFDLKRRHEDVQRDGKGFMADGSGVPSSTQHVSADSPYYVMPIPQSEIDANKNMVQNKY